MQYYVVQQEHARERPTTVPTTATVAAAVAMDYGAFLGGVAIGRSRGGRQRWKKVRGLGGEDGWKREKEVCKNNRWAREGGESRGLCKGEEGKYRGE